MTPNSIQKILGKISHYVVGAVISSLGVLIFVPVFVYSLYSGFSIAWKLIYWFGAVLSACHFYFAIAPDLTAQTLKKIDYWYLGVAAAGIVVFAIAQTERREHIMNIYLEQDWRQSKERMVNSAKEYYEYACDSKHLHILHLHCKQATTVLDLTNSNPRSTTILESAAQLSKSQKDIINKMMDDYANNKEFDLKKEELEAYDFAEDLKLNMFAFTLRSDPSDEYGTNPTERSMTFYLLLLSYAFLWPFILIAAIALRITKVTIELYGWASENDDR